MLHRLFRCGRRQLLRWLLNGGFGAGLWTAGRQQQHDAEGPVDPEGKGAVEQLQQAGVLVHHGEGLGDDVIGDPEADGGDGSA